MLIRFCRTSNSVVLRAGGACSTPSKRPFPHALHLLLTHCPQQITQEHHYPGLPHRLNGSSFGHDSSHLWTLFCLHLVRSHAASPYCTLARFSLPGGRIFQKTISPWYARVPLTLLSSPHSFGRARMDGFHFSTPVCVPFSLRY